MEPLRTPGALPSPGALAWLRRAGPDGALPWPPDRWVLCECRREGWAALSAEVLVAALYDPSVESCWRRTADGDAVVAAQPELAL